MNRFTRKAALLLVGFFAAFNANAALVEKPNNWKWVSMTRTQANQQAYIYSVGHEIFITTANTPTEKNIENAQAWTLNYNTNGTTSISCKKDNKDYVIRLNYWKFGMLSSETGVYEKGNKGSTDFTLTEGKVEGYNLTKDGKFFTADTDENKYTAGNTNDAGNDWMLIDPNNTDQINNYKNFYAAYASAYAAAKSLKDAALPTDMMNKLTEVLAKETDYQNVEANTAELNNIVTEIKSLQKKVYIADNYATICLPFNAVIPAGVAAYRLDNYDTDHATMELKKYGEEGDILPAGKGFVLYTDNTDATAEYDFNFTTDKAADMETNLLDGTVEEIAQDAAKYYWVISKSATTGKVGFFILDDNVKIPANKAFFAVDRNSVNAAACSVFSLNGSATAITAATAATTATVVAIYNAEGKQQSALAKGLNIVKMSDGSVKKIMK